LKSYALIKMVFPGFLLRDLSAHTHLCALMRAGLYPCQTNTVESTFVL